MISLQAPEGAPLIIRPMVKSDRAFVATSWLRSYEDLARISKSVYSKHHPAVVDTILDSAECLIATSPDTPTVIHGFVVHSTGVLHYCYVARPLRRGGIARWMVKSALGYIPNVECSHRLPFAHRGITFNPYLLGMPL